MRWLLHLLLYSIEYQNAERSFQVSELGSGTPHPTFVESNGIMGKNRKKRQRGKEQANEESTRLVGNPYFDEASQFMSTIPENERDNFFSADALSPERRSELWELQADAAEVMIQKYAWAIPDERAVRVLRSFSPIIEIGCGARAYWCRLMKAAGIDVVGYDKDPAVVRFGDKVTSVPLSGFPVRKGGPEVLGQKKGKNRTLFLCYPDEEDETSEQKKDAPLESMAAKCLRLYSGEFIIHVGETFLVPTPSMEQTPWGRSTSSEFLERLAAEYHCVLHLRLPSWIHTRDTLTVWKRSKTIPMVFQGEDEGETDELEFRHIPKEERLFEDLAAPCMRHLLEYNPVVQRLEESAKETSLLETEELRPFKRPKSQN